MSRAGRAHDIVKDFLSVEKNLSRKPTKQEYFGAPGLSPHGKFSAQVIEEVFGGWTYFLQAVGSSGKGRKKRDKQEISKRAFESRQKERASRFTVSPPPIAARALIIGDLHAPYNHPDAINFLIELDKKYKFDFVANAGDELDFHAISFHDHDPDLLSPGHELEAAIKILEPLYKTFPEMKLAESNHGSLAYRKGKHFGLPRYVLKSYREVLNAPAGWDWQFEIKMQFPNGKCAFLNHAYGSNVLRASQERGASLIQGHVHTRFGIDYWANYDEIFFAAQAGCLIDDKSMAMAYNKTQTKRPLLGCLGIFNGVPKLLPMQLDKKGRWTGWVP